MSTPTTSAAASTVYVIDTAHTHVQFAVRHMMIATVRGAFKQVQGTVRVDALHPEAPAVDVSIDVASIETRDGQRDAHLKSADFFDAATFPTITFKADRLIGSPDAPFPLVGDLTIRGVTREVVLEVTPEGSGKDPWGNERAGYSLTTAIRRGEYGLKWNQALETGGVLVGDEVKISADVELVKQK